jgi:acyl-CoA thioesterase
MTEPDSAHALKIVRHMLDNDPFSQWMGVKLLDVRKGYCRISCRVKKEMLNGLGVTHGGIVFSLADSALAFAACSLGKVSPGVDHSISFIKKTAEGDPLTAEAVCVHAGNKTGVVRVDVTNQNEELIAIMKGTVYRTSKPFPV